MADASPEALTTEKWCHLPGQPCYKAKRAASSVDQVKRSADALAEAAAGASPEDVEKWCALPGQGCYKYKRAAEAINEAKRSADALEEAVAALGA